MLNKRSLRQGWLLLLVLALALPAGAGVVNVSNVSIGGSSYRAFQDTTTSLIWLDLDNFFDATSTYNNVVVRLVGSGYHVATWAELQVLEASIPAVPANFAAEVVIVGGNYPGSPVYSLLARNLIWGVYDDGNSSDNVSWAWKYDYDIYWNQTANVWSASSTLRSANPDLGVWVVADTAGAVIPEPGTLVLLGLGLAGLAIRLRRA